MDYFIAQNKYGKYAVPKGTEYKPDIQLLLKGQVHEERTIEFMINNCGDGHIIHAGTFFGDFLPALGKLPNKKYAFEPVKRFYDCAVRTLELNFPNNDHNIDLSNFGLAEATYDKKILLQDSKGKQLGGSALYTYDEPQKLHELRKRHPVDDNLKQVKLEDTKLTTLDEYIPNEEHGNISILQLDLEGYEEKALMGALDIVEKSRPILILEFWRDKNNPNRVPPEFEHDFFKKEIFSRGYKVVEEMYQNKIFRIV